MSDENKRSDGKADISKESEATEQNLIKATCKELNLKSKLERSEAFKSNLKDFLAD